MVPPGGSSATPDLFDQMTNANCFVRKNDDTLQGTGADTQVDTQTVRDIYPPPQISPSSNRQMVPPLANSVAALVT